MTESQTQAHSFHTIARQVFAPLYPVVAAQVLRWFEFWRGRPLTRGTCLDVGSAAGHLGVALARQTDLEVTLVDVNPDALALSTDLIDAGLAHRVSTVVADVHALPGADESFDLVVSRGSLWFWRDKAQAFRELWRVLKPGGLAWVGGGFGSAELRDSIHQTMVAREGDRWVAGQKQRRQGNSAADLVTLLGTLGLPYHLIDDDSGTWVLLPKPQNAQKRSAL